MQTHRFDRYEQRNSPIHQLDPRVKTVVALLSILSNALLPDGAWLAFLAAWGLLLLFTKLAHLPLFYTTRRSLIVLPFTLAAVTIIFTLPGEVVASWQIGSRLVTISDTGLIRFASIVIRSWLSVQMALLLTATTQFPDLMHALHHLRVPAVLVSILSFMYRYLFVLADEATRLLRAREARSARAVGAKSGGTVAWRAKVAGQLVGQLFLRSLERSDRVYQAMIARGYDGRLLTLNPHHMRPRDWLLGSIAVVLLLALQIAGRLLP
jgi:cobalt/nickel transport system permease protein